MRAGFALITAALAASTALHMPARAQTAAALSPAQAEAHKAACDALAAVVLPDGQMESQTDLMVEQMLTQLFKQEPDMQTLEAAYPGMRDAMGAGIKPALIEVIHKIMPTYRAELSALYQSRLTTADARAAADFMRSPPMVKFIGATRNNMKFERILGDLDPEKPVTAADVRSDLQSAGVRSIKAVTPAEMATIQQFMTGPLGLKLRALNPQKLVIDTKWMNYTDPQSEKAVAGAVEQAMISHIALTDPETAELLREEMAKERAAQAKATPTAATPR